MKSRLSITVAALLLPALSPAQAQQVLANPTVHYDARHDVSLPLRDLARTAGQHRTQIEMPEPGHKRLLPEGPPGADTAVQRFYLPTIHTVPVLSFDAVREDEQNAQVPDTNGAVGSTQFVEITNFDYSVYNKSTGKNVLKPTDTNTIFAGFGGRCENTDPGDPVVVWDRLADRWLVSYFNYETAYALCIAVSKTSDATGMYNRYEYDYDYLPDYPKYAVWPDAYYSTSNIDGGAAEPCAYDRNAMLSGASAAVVCFTPANVSSLLPSDLDGATAPPKGAPDHYLQLGNTTNLLQEYDFHVNFAKPGKSTFTGPNNVTVPNFNEACSGFGYCIPQPNSGEEVEGLGDRLMFRLAYRNFGDHESLVVAHNVAPASGSAVSAMRWYELRATPAGGAFTLYQSGTFQNKSTSLWMGSAAMDKDGNIALGMSASSDAKDPSVWYTGRLSSDPLGKMEAPTTAAKGTAIETGDSQRWGDYSSMSVDPGDDCTFWYSQMYYNKKHGGAVSGDWDTRIAAFKFDDCN
ncbi:MAG TPA: hypothetical protein VKR31_15730 [Rhizomicrobium sp.]|nr:hypothetical protein [Rhizomicrobium sp.]